jgi:hypothetical protein
MSMPDPAPNIDEMFCWVVFVEVVGVAVLAVLLVLVALVVVVMIWVANSFTLRVSASNRYS